MKTINLQRAILVDLDWLEGEINQLSQSKGGLTDFGKGLRWAYSFIQEIKSIPASKVTDKLLDAAIEANNHARRLHNNYEPNNELMFKKINERAEFLSQFADKDSPKIVQS